MRLALKLFRGEPAISGFDWNFSPIHKSSPPFSTDVWFGPPWSFTSTSTCSWIGHPVSGLRHATIALFRLAFASAPNLQFLTLLHNVTRRSVLQKVRDRALLALSLLVNTGFQVLFHSPPGVLFTFPSRYWCAIGHRVVLRLGWWSTQVRTGFHVPGPTQGPRRAVRSGFAYGAVTRCGRPSHAVPLPSRTCARGRQPPDARPCNPVGGTPAGYARSTVWPSVPFRSPLLGESRD